MSFDIKPILKNRSKYGDELEIQLGDTKMSLGDLRAYDEATEGQLASQLQAERQKLQAQEAELSRGREELVKTWTELQSKGQATQQQAQPNGQDWRQDPFFAPIAQFLEKEISSKITDLSTQYKQMQNALALGVKYIGDMQAKTKFALVRQQAPESWREELKFDDLYKMAADQKMLDEGGFPDVEKAYEKWSEPKRQQQLKETLRAEIRAEEEQNRVQAMLGRPGSGTGMQQQQQTGPKNLQEAFDMAKQDPQIQKLIYGGSA